MSSSGDIAEGFSSEQAKVLNMDLHHLGPWRGSAKFNRAMLNQGYRSVLDVVSKSEDELLKIKGVGLMTVDNFKSVLADHKIQIGPFTENQRRSIEKYGKSVKNGSSNGQVKKVEVALR